ncbi:L,D-transpeptidase [bacterium]|nr:L,D-transpeptidase [bacterium]
MSTIETATHNTALPIARRTPRQVTAPLSPDQIVLARPGASEIKAADLYKLCLGNTISSVDSPTATQTTLPVQKVQRPLPCQSAIITAIPREVVDASSISGKVPTGPNAERVTAFDVYWQDGPNSQKTRITGMATSGNPLGDSLNPRAAYEGRTPAGSYIIDPKEITDLRSAWKFRATWGGGMLLDHDSWGTVRAPLHPCPGTNTWGRSDFFLHGHGSKHAGTAGCLGLPNEEAKRLFNKMEAWSTAHPGATIDVKIL